MCEISHNSDKVAVMLRIYWTNHLLTRDRMNFISSAKMGNMVFCGQNDFRFNSTQDFLSFNITHYLHLTSSPELTYYVSSGTLNSTRLLTLCHLIFFLHWSYFNTMQQIAAVLYNYILLLGGKYC